jgi:hypothetical protein
MKETVVVSAFPCCGKSYAYKNYQNYYSILDSDSSDFSWLKDENGNNTKVRNPEFPGNYIEHIKDNLGKVDIIFVSSHLAVREAMQAANIRYCTVYPKFDVLREWVSRMCHRGSDENFIIFQIEHWAEFTTKIDSEPHGYKLYRLGEGEYLDRNFLDKIINRNNSSIKKGFDDISKIVKKHSNGSGSVDEIYAIFAAVDQYRLTNPNETAAMEDYIGKRCKYRDVDFL